MNFARDPAPLSSDDLAPWGRALNWMTAGPRTRSVDIHAQLLRHGLLNITTLVMLSFSMMLLASVAIIITGQAWAWAWLAAEILLGAAKLSSQRTIEKEFAAGRTPSMDGPIVAGLATALVIGIAGFMSVRSGDPTLILLVGICLGGLVGGTSVRSAGTPRLTVIVMCLLALPYSLATLLSPLPYLPLIGIQMPFFLGGLILVLREDYAKLVDLYLAQRENRWLAHHDLLTGLPNRTMELKCFDDLLRQRGDVEASGLPLFTVFCLDLDGFKHVNDNYGHEAGDAVLVIAARRLRRCIRDVDFLFRVGGDEFVVLLPSISPEEAEAIAHRIIASIVRPIDIGHDVPLSVGISIGSARAPMDGATADELLRSADSAMYEAKRRGKGLYVTLPLVADLVELAPEAGISRLPAADPAASALQFPLPLAGNPV